MNWNSTQSREYLSFNRLLVLMRLELDDARDEHDILSDLLMQHYEDEDSDILEDYVDDLQDYVDEMEELTDNIARLIDIRRRLSEDIVRVNAKIKELEQ